MHRIRMMSKKVKSIYPFPRVALFRTMWGLVQHSSLRLCSKSSQDVQGESRLSNVSKGSSMHAKELKFRWADAYLQMFKSQKTQFIYIKKLVQNVCLCTFLTTSPLWGDREVGWRLSQLYMGKNIVHPGKSGQFIARPSEHLGITALLKGTSSVPWRSWDWTRNPLPS